MLSRDAETVRTLASLAKGCTLNTSTLNLNQVLRNAERLAERLEGKPRDDRELAARRRNRRSCAALAQH